MTDDASTATDAGSRKTALRRKPLQAVIAAALAEGPPTLTQNEFRSEFGSACRMLWEEGHTAEGVAERYIAQLDGASVRLRKQIRAEIRQLWAEFENGTWRPGAAGPGARGVQSSQKADQTDTQGEGEHQERDPAEAEVDKARAFAAHGNGEQPSHPDRSGEDAGGAPDDPAPTDNEDGGRSPEPDLADTAGEEEKGPPDDDEEDAEALALRRELERAAREARGPGYGPGR
ncbi:hypothetical protein [Bosea sp. (in: a-proteobacteria)]|uniref:hypothetical protein n=1 Tax=Bosea sp. (in: a-proteobacteria) TaxID=1871050 RepID=UPI0025C063B7|nr:hypothetical protein [Bosea sp. (in: a-proteobacteria)]